MLVQDQPPEARSLQFSLKLEVMRENRVTHRSKYAIQ